MGCQIGADGRIGDGNMTTDKEQFTGKNTQEMWSSYETAHVVLELQ